MRKSMLENSCKNIFFKHCRLLYRVYTKYERFLVPYTRQQIADMTGLRVETVIRTVSRLKEEGKISVIKHKIYLN